MARNINRKLLLSDGAKASIAEDVLSISGAKGELSLNVHDTVKVSLEEDSILFNPKDLEDKTSMFQDQVSLTSLDLKFTLMDLKLIILLYGIIL